MSDRSTCARCGRPVERVFMRYGDWFWKHWGFPLPWHFAVPEAPT